MHLNDPSTSRRRELVRSRSVRIGVAALLVSAATVFGASTPASAFYPPESGGPPYCTPSVDQLGQWICIPIP